MRVHSHLPGGGASPPRGARRSFWTPAALDSSSRFAAPADSDSRALSSFSVAEAARIVRTRARVGRDRRAPRRATGAAARVDARVWLAMAARVFVRIGWKARGTILFRPFLSEEIGWMVRAAL